MTLAVFYFKVYCSLSLTTSSFLLQKTEDRLNLSKEDLQVWGLQEKKQSECEIEKVKSSVVICRISGDKDGEISVDSLMV